MNWLNKASTRNADEIDVYRICKQTRPDKLVQMRNLSRAFSACIQSMEVDVKAQSRQSLSCSQTRSIDFF